MRRTWQMIAASAVPMVLMVLAAGPAVAAGEKPARPNENSPLGINLAGIADWSTEIVFVDVFKQSRQWISQAKGAGWGKGGELELDKDGWVKRLRPGQWAETPVAMTGGHNPAGDYLCLYDGEGKIDFWGDARVKSRSPGRIAVTVRPKDAIWLRLMETNPADPVRNIRLILPGFEKTYLKQPFHPALLKRWAKFRAIRFMDWGATNGSPVSKWSDRSTPNRQTQSGRKGVAPEYMIQLANALHADPWFCMPHLATDEYVRNFAKLVKQRLDPGLKVHVEYSNECWNFMFEQARYCSREGRRAKLSDNAYQAQLRFYSRQCVRMFRLWEEVFGGSGRLVRVLASQSANPWVSRQVMEFEDAWKRADALAIAPYFGHHLGSPKTQGEVAKMSVEQVLDACEKAIEKNRATVKRQAALAAERKLDLIAYEGGQHLVGHGGAENNQALMKLFHAANRHPRMKELYLKDLAGWKAAGGKTFAVFSSVGRFSKWGSWGVLEYHGQDPKTAPKYQALLEFIEGNPRWWK